MHTIKIANVTLAFDSAHRLTQTYEPLGGRSLIRLASGAAVLQSAWSGKLRTTIRAAGRYPDALHGVDWNSTIEIECTEPLGIHGATTTITIPAARRTDWAPFAKALVNGRLVSTTMTISTNTCTLTAVSGATSYAVFYFPKLTCYAVAPPSRSYDARVQGNAGWELIAEEA